MLTKHTFVAEDQGKITGFAELEEDGYIDCFYCHKDFQGQRTGASIYHAIETKAEELGLFRLTAEVSITAKPFFLKMGFSAVKKQKVFTRGEQLINYVMEKGLKPAGQPAH